MRRRDCLLLGAMAFVPRLAYAINFPEYPAKAAKDYPGSSAIDGVMVAVEPLTDPAGQKRYFKVDFAKNGFLPVFVVVENGSAEGSFILKREDIGAYAGDQQESQPGQVLSGRSKTGENLALASAIALSPAGMVISGILMIRATEVRQNLIKKDLRSSTLSPGQSTRGFVFIPLPSDPEKRKHLRMRVRVVKLGSDQPIDFEFPI
jgi:hypothetical protein